MGTTQKWNDEESHWCPEDNIAELLIRTQEKAAQDSLQENLIQPSQENYIGLVFNQYIRNCMQID